jgi:phosphoribosylformylglycinamidine cyclo-ligase
MVTYKDSGVDIDAGDAAVDLIGKHVRSTYTPQVLTGSHGGFAGLFQLDYPAGLLRRNYRNPVLVACTDGVGTKLEIAYKTGIADTIGIDLVAMCVNDLVVQGADPLFFLDYIAVGKMEPKVVAAIVKGIAEGCRESGCAILGGETAEMPGFYPVGHYELAGFSVGVAERTRLVLGDRVRPGDKVIGLFSSGIHSNGYSLVRKVFFGGGSRSVSLDRVLPGCELPLGEELLKPTRIYVKPVLSVLRRYRNKRPVHALSHITGGGLIENIPRSIPKSCDVTIRKKSWEPPAIFRHLAKRGRVPPREMFRVFNMGIGMVMIVSEFFAESILSQLDRMKVPAAMIGEVTRGKGRVKFK